MRGYHVYCIKHKIDCFVIHKVRDTNSDKSGSEIKEWDIGKHYISQKLGLRCKLRYISLLTPHISSFFSILTSLSRVVPSVILLSCHWNEKHVKGLISCLNTAFIKRNATLKRFSSRQCQQENLLCFLLTFRAFRETTWTFLTVFR